MEVEVDVEVEATGAGVVGVLGVVLLAVTVVCLLEEQ